MKNLQVSQISQMSQCADLTRRISRGNLLSASEDLWNLAKVGSDFNVFFFQMFCNPGKCSMFTSVKASDIQRGVLDNPRFIGRAPE